MTAQTDLLAGCVGDAKAVKGVVALKVTVPYALINAATDAGDGFDQISSPNNLLEFAVPDLLASDIVLGASLDAAYEAEANVFPIGALKSGAGKVKILFWSGGSDDEALASGPVHLWVYVARV